MAAERERNNLDRAASPYLRQHCDNPVWWQEWTPEVLAQARESGLPLFVSVGYSTCHWCHVMAREAFSDHETADFLNRHFICIKVDRETRPDLDQYLMQFMQSQQGHGGWPLNVFLVDPQRPVFALTYAPARAAGDTPSLLEIARRVRDYLAAGADQIQPFQAVETPPPPVMPAVLEAGLLAGFDRELGGVGHGAKFPPHATLLFILYQLAVAGRPEMEEVCRRTLTAMRRGGLHDHLQGGVFRYCVDPRWTIPHFEKMLYDQALGLWCHALAARVLSCPASRRMAGGIMRCLRETFELDGFFATAFDADTDHREGMTYLWRYDELKRVLSPEKFAELAEFYHLPSQGNFEGWIHLTRKNDQPLDKVEADLLELRRRRPQPMRDDKILCGINALTVCAMLQAARLLDRPAWEERAENLACRLREVFWDGRRLGHCLCDGRVQQQGFLFDASALLLAATMLGEREADWLPFARELAQYVAGFHKADGWVESAAPDFAPVPASWFDHPVPSSISLAALGLARTAALNSEPPEPLDYRPPHHADFYNVAAMFSQGLFHLVHSPQPLPWSRLPANVMQLRGAEVMDCYRNRCGPLRAPAPGGTKLV
ncbi:MAG: DUF255 domain-containing protein [Lentisphaerae bacterium]|nr:DUF255 domain-containing protein [Lentisphaerota bacterium]